MLIINVMDKPKVRKYESINVLPETKLRVDKFYYKMKVVKKFKTFDQFINHLLDALQEK
jgi:hypothetical protein